MKKEKVKTWEERALVVLKLINAEFISDPMSTQCFDLKSIVEEVRKLVEEQKNE